MVELGDTILTESGCTLMVVKLTKRSVHLSNGNRVVQKLSYKKLTQGLQNYTIHNRALGIRKPPAGMVGGLIQFVLLPKRHILTSCIFIPMRVEIFPFAVIFLRSHVIAPERHFLYRAGCPITAVRQAQSTPLYSLATGYQPRWFHAE